MFKTQLIIFIIVFSFSRNFAQFSQHDFGIAANLVYTTSAEIFLNPNSSNSVVRNQSYLLEDIFNPSVDLRYRISEKLIIGLSVERIKKTTITEFVYLDSNEVTILNVNEGFKVIPIELTAHYFFPFSTEDFKFLMGGGIGYYWGWFIREFDTGEATVAHRKFALGFHVSASMDYIIIENLSARFEMKFRNPSYNVINNYTEATYQGKTLKFLNKSFETKIDVNGLAFTVGMVFHF